MPQMGSRAFPGLEIRQLPRCSTLIAILRGYWQRPAARSPTPATVVALYLSPAINLRLRPTLQRDLRPGSRIVSHDFDMGDWRPERTVEILVERYHRVFLWRVP